MREGEGANLPYMPKSELRLLDGLVEVFDLNANGFASGVSSLSPCSAGDDSGPEEKSMSKGLRGVVKDGSRNGDG